MGRIRGIASARRLRGAGSLVAALAAFHPGAASAADYVLKFGTATMNVTQHLCLEFYKEALDQASKGRIEVQIYPTASSARSRARRHSHEDRDAGMTAPDLQRREANTH